MSGQPHPDERIAYSDAIHGQGLPPAEGGDCQPEFKKTSAQRSYSARNVIRDLADYQPDA